MRCSLKTLLASAAILAAAVTTASARDYSDTDRRAILSAASAAGVLYMCNDTGLYTSPVADDMVNRIVSAGIAADKAPDGSGPIYQLGAQLFGAGRSNGVQLTAVDDATNENGFRVDKFQAHDAASCKKVEADLKAMRAPGGVLDIAPYKAGQDA